MKQPVIDVMVNGLPGNMARAVYHQLIADNRFRLVPFSLTGPEITETSVRAGDVSVELIRPEHARSRLTEIKAKLPPFIAVDFTHPDAVNTNAELYCKLGIPFVMGTTGGDRTKLMDTVRGSVNCAVIAPNMAKQIVGFTAMMEFMAQNFSGIFKGYFLRILESHQKGKADTSGTAKAMVKHFQAMGLDFSENLIEKERDPRIQEQNLGVPKEYLSGHAYHTYVLGSPDNTVRFAFTHNVNGREIYAAGALDAVLFLAKNLRHGYVFSMIDVLRG